MLRKGPNALWEGGEGVEGEVERCFVTLFSELTERSVCERFAPANRD